MFLVKCNLGRGGKQYIFWLGKRGNERIQERNREKEICYVNEWRGGRERNSWMVKRAFGE